MEIIAKFYPHLWSTERIDQLVLTSEVTITQELRGFGEAEVLLPIVPGIKEDVIIELYESNSNEDRLIFRGFVYEINPVWWQFQLVKIIARSEKAILHRRKALQSYNFTNQPVSTIVSELLQIYNDDYNENWDVAVQKEEHITLEIATGDDYYDILDEICEQKERFWEVDAGTLWIKQHGADRTASQIIAFDGFSPHPWNISSIELIGTASGGNVVLIEDSQWHTSIDKSQYAGVLTWVVSKQIRKGDNNEKAKQFAKEQSRPQRKYQIQVAHGALEADVGDTIKVEVVNTNSFYDYQGDAIVQSKTITYSNASKMVQYGVQEFILPLLGDEWRIAHIEKTIRLLKTKKPL